MRNVADVLTHVTGNKYQKGTLFGVEIEVEDAAGAEELPGWTLTHDGSLRNNGMEYIFSKGYNYSTSHKLLTQWAEYAARTKFKHNYRTSLHIHANVADLNMNQLLGLFCTYYVLEPMFFDDGRWESPYCIPITEASCYLTSAISCLTHNDGDYLGNLGIMDYKYMALGTCRLMDLGTFEFRMFTGANDAAHLIKRLDYVNLLVNAARTQFEHEPVTPKAVGGVASQLITAYKWDTRKARHRMLHLLDDISLSLHDVAKEMPKPAKPVRRQPHVDVLHNLEAEWDDDWGPEHVEPMPAQPVPAPNADRYQELVDRVLANRAGDE
jgi:hypothetical protein